MYLNRKLLFKNIIVLLFHNITVFFDQINAALVSIRDFFKKKKRSDLKLFHSSVYSYSVIMTLLYCNMLSICPNPVLNVLWNAELSPCALPCILHFIKM